MMDSHLDCSLDLALDLDNLAVVDSQVRSVLDMKVLGLDVQYLDKCQMVDHYFQLVLMVAVEHMVSVRLNVVFEDLNLSLE